MLALESAQEVQDLLAENDVDFTIEEINKLHEELVKKAQQAEEGEDADGEIDDEDLEDVAGGWFGIVMPIITTVITCVIKSVTCRW